MIFEVKTNKETVKMDRFSLLELLFGKVLGKTREDFAGLSTAFSHHLQGKNVLSQFNMDQLITTSFSLGYFYRVFMEKNDVKITGVKDELVNKDNTEPTSESGSR